MNKLSKVSTVVGSLPFDGYTKENMIAGLELQIRAGVDYPSYPQLVPMVSQFLDPLTKVSTKLTRAGDYFKLEGDTFEFPKEPIATEYGEFMIEYFKNNPEAKTKIKGMKACLTGPFTIANDIMVESEVVGGKNPMIYPEPRAIMSKKLLLEIADFMANVAKRYSEMG
jgi:methionine synthase II (cobalamin-independent)